MSNKSGRSEKKEKMKAPVAAEKGALESATEKLTEVPSTPKKAPLKSVEPKTYAKYKVALAENERHFLNFGHIKSQVKDMNFAKKFIAHHVLENFGIKLTDALFAKLEATVKFNLDDPNMTGKEGFAHNNKGMDNTAQYADVMRILKTELGPDADKLSYDAISVTRLLLRKAMGTNPIINDVQCVTVRGDKYLAANNICDEFEDRGARCFGQGVETNKVSTFRNLKGKFYNKNEAKPE